MGTPLLCVSWELTAGGCATTGPGLGSAGEEGGLSPSLSLPGLCVVSGLVVPPAGGAMGVVGAVGTSGAAGTNQIAACELETCAMYVPAAQRHHSHQPASWVAVPASYLPLPQPEAGASYSSVPDQPASQAGLRLQAT
jgi:hypothetical protein